MQKQLQEHFGEVVRCTACGYSVMHDYGNSEVPMLQSLRHWILSHGFHNLQKYSWI